jgi:D-tyrosyl-tRNA(Tyr) deacylase
VKIVLQRVKQAAVEVEQNVVGEIGQGVCLLVGIEKGDTQQEAHNLANKIIELRIFPDEEEKMNLSLLDIQGEVLAVSQFTLAGSVKKGRRPSFDNAEEPERAEKLFSYFMDLIKQRGVKVETGTFGALMEIRLVNVGPVTFILEKKKQ